MKVYFVVALLCLLVCGHVLCRKYGCKRKRCPTDVCRKQCPLLEVGSNIVTTRKFMSMILNKEWLSIYTVEINTTLAYKTINIWTKAGRIVTRETTFPRNRVCEYVRVDYTMEMTKCGIQLNEVGLGKSIERFYSQDLSKYFWWFVCIMPINNGQGCIEGFFDLRIRDRRAIPNNGNGEINLYGLPWGKIAADLKQVRNLDFDDSPGPIYAWIGQECPFIRPRDQEFEQELYF